MAQLMSVVMDDVTYRVRIKSDSPFEESFRIEDGENNRSCSMGKKVEMCLVPTMTIQCILSLIQDTMTIMTHFI